MKHLPDFPSLPYLRREAKAIKADHRNGLASVCSTIGHYDTSLHGLSDEEILDTRFSILDAQRVVARQYGFSSWSRLRKFVLRGAAGRSPSDPALRDAILVRHGELRSLQEDLRHGRGSRESRRDKHRRYRELAADSTAFMNDAYDRHGWPGPDVVGPDCVEAMAHVSANAVYDAEFQSRTARLMGLSLPEGGSDARFHALLTDRYLTLSRRPTIYGMSFGSYRDARGNIKFLSFDVVDPEGLDRRRATVGFQAVATEEADYEKEARRGDWKLPTREQSLAEMNALSVEGGYLRR